MSLSKCACRDCLLECLAEFCQRCAIDCAPATDRDCHVAGAYLLTARKPLDTVKAKR